MPPKRIMPKELRLQPVTDMPSSTGIPQTPAKPTDTTSIDSFCLDSVGVEVSSGPVKAMPSPTAPHPIVTSREMEHALAFSHPHVYVEPTSPASPPLKPSASLSPISPGRQLSAQTLFLQSSPVLDSHSPELEMLAKTAEPGTQPTTLLTCEQRQQQSDDIEAQLIATIMATNASSDAPVTP